MPAGSCDTHCHVFGPPERFPYAPQRTYTPEDAPKEQLFALHRRLGIERAIVVQAGCHGVDNSAMLDVLATGEGRYRGIALVAPDVTQAELNRLHEAGVRGIRFNFMAHLGRAAAPDVVLSLAGRIAELGWHVLVHIEIHQVEELDDLLRKLPTDVVVDHMGRPSAANGLDQPGLGNLRSLLADHKFWVKVSGADRVSATGRPYSDAVPFAWRLVEEFPDQVLWGTDWPHPNVRQMPDDADLVDLLPEIAPEEGARHKLLVDNPSRLYWWDA